MTNRDEAAKTLPAGNEQHNDQEPLDSDAAQRRAADVALVQAVRSLGPDHPETEHLRSLLRTYGVGVLTSWAVKGELAERIWRVTRIRLPVVVAPDEARSVTFLAVTVALRKFVDNYIFGQERWDPERSSLKTSFVRQCLYSFVDEFRRFEREERRPAEVPTSDSALFELLGNQTWMPWTVNTWSQDPAERLISRVQVEEALVRLTPQDRRVLALYASGLTVQQVAHVLEVGVSRVREHLRHIRLKWQEDHAAPGSFEAPEWKHLRQWGIGSAEEAARVKRVIDRCRASYDDPSRAALYRPLPDVDLNQLAIILSGMDVEGTVGVVPSRWVANSARVCRAVLASVQEEVPSVRRPEGRRKGIAKDVWELYRDLTKVLTGRYPATR